MISVSLHRLAFNVNTIGFFESLTCDVIHKTEDTIRMQILHNLLAYFTTLTNFKNFKNGIMEFYTTQAKYLHNKLRINFPSQVVFLIVSIFPFL